MGDEYTRSTKYYQDRALEQTISHGFSSLADAELNLSRQLSRDLNDAIARNQKTQNDASRLIVEELRYQKQHFDANADRIINAIEIAGIQSVGAIEALGRYLGDKLSHISYQMELMTGIGQQFEYIMRDESLHLAFGCDLINTIKVLPSIRSPFLENHFLFSELFLLFVDTISP